MRRSSAHALYDFALGMSLLALVPLALVLWRSDWGQLKWLALSLAPFWVAALIVGRRRRLSIRDYARESLDPPDAG